MSDKNNNFVMDVAKERTFVNQSKEYNEEFAAWRADERNPYGYKFVQDVREHSYVVDEGYLKSKSDVAEKIALFKCLSLLGVTMILMIGMSALRSFFLEAVHPDFSGGVVYYKDRTALSDNLSVPFTITAMILDMAVYLVPAFIFMMVTKIPKKVVLPLKKCKYSIAMSSVSIMLVVAIMGRFCRLVFANFYAAAGGDAVYMFIYNGNSLAVTILSWICQCVALPICMEILFRGVVLQTFRQFGDFFAITVSSIVGSFICYDLSYIGYAALCSVALGYSVVRSGSLRLTIYMHICAATVNYFLATINFVNERIGLIVEASVCALIIGLSIVAYSRLTAKKSWNFNLGRDSTEMTFGQKLKIMLSTDTIVVWLVAAVVYTFICFRGL